MVYWDYIGNMDKKVETSIVYKGLYRDNWFSFPLAHDTEAPRSYELELGMGTAPMTGLLLRNLD